MAKLRLKDLRENEHMTQATFADKMDFTQQSYSRWEANLSEPKLDTLIKFADYYKVTLDYLCGRNFSTFGEMSEHEMEILEKIKKLTPQSTKEVLSFISWKLYEQDRASSQNEIAE